MSLSIARPDAGEHAPYFAKYIDAAAAELAAGKGNDIIALLAAQTAEWRALIGSADPALASHRYAPGKWTLAESLVHVADTERVFSYRLLRIARGDATPLAGFEQDDWVPESRADRRSLSDILAEIEAVRAATLILVRSLDDTAVSRMGVASNNPVSARSLVWMLAGHMAHHLTITRERYLA